MNKNDIIRLQHMIDAACEAVSFAEGKEGGHHLKGGVRDCRKRSDSNKYCFITI